MSNGIQKPLLRLFSAATSLIPGAPGAALSSFVNRVQDNTGQALPQLGDNANGQTIECKLTTQFQNFPTRLGRKFSGYSVTANPSNLSVVNDTSPNPALFIRLKCAAGNGIVTLSVF